MRIIKEIILVLILTWTALLIIAYLIAVWEKISRPNFKNMNDDELIWIGAIALILGFIDYLIIKRWVKAKNE